MRRLLGSSRWKHEAGVRRAGAGGSGAGCPASFLPAESVTFDRAALVPEKAAVVEDEQGTR